MRIFDFNSAGSKAISINNCNDVHLTVPVIYSTQGGVIGKGVYVASGSTVNMATVNNIRTNVTVTPVVVSHLSLYYKAYGDVVRFDPTLVEQVVFAQHNLVSDGSFNEFNLIVCRNVMIYFDRTLQDRVHDLFYRSLSRSGVLALGHKESIRFTSHADAYEELDPVEKLYQRRR